MKIVGIGAAPTALGAAFRLNELKETNEEEAGDVELLLLEQVKCDITHYYLIYIADYRNEVKQLKKEQFYRIPKYRYFSR